MAQQTVVQAHPNASQKAPIKKPTIWEWILFYLVTLIHNGSPFLDKLFGHKVKLTAQQIGDKTGQVVLVTGANSGTGYETAKAYYEQGAKVLFACRSEKRAIDAIADIKKGGSRDVFGTMSYNPVTTNGSLQWLNLDLADLNSVDDMARQILELEPRLDVLFLNAGIMMIPPGDFTKQGYSLQFGTNVVGHQRLVSRLLPLLKRTSLANPASPSRVISLASVGHMFAPKGGPEDGGIKYDALKRGDKLLNGQAEYGVSKWGNIALANYINLHHGPSSGVTDGEVIAISLHPGFVSTNLGSHIPSLMAMKNWPSIQRAVTYTPAFGALNSLWAANIPVAEAREISGKYVAPVQSVIPARPDLRYPQAWEKLWDWCEAEAKRAE